MELIVRWSAIISDVVFYIFNEYVSHRQYQTIRSTKKIPEDVEDIYDKNKFEKSRLYEIDKHEFSFVKNFIFAIMALIILSNNYVAKLYTLSESILVSTGLSSDHEILVSCICVTLFSIYEFVVGLPFSYYSNFVIEERYGFNKQTFGFFLKDKVKKLLLNLVISNVMMSFIIKIIKISGSSLYIYVPIAILIFQLFMVSIYQDYIAPLFDKFTPLEESELKTSIEKLAEETGFPLKNILVIEGSKRSSHSNAYFIGLFGKRTIVLFDTLFKTVVSDSSDEEKTSHCNNDQVLAILGHELGHWQHGHICKLILVSMVKIVFIFYICSKMMSLDYLYTAFGFGDKRPVIIGLYIITGYFLSPFLLLFGWFETYLSRLFEFQSDKFSTNLKFGEHLIGALKILQVSNLSFPVNDYLYSSLHHSHPSVVERINYIRSLKVD